MKAAVYIPADGLLDARHAAKTKREAVVTASVDFHCCRLMAALVKYSGTCPDLMTVDEIQVQRR